MIKTDIRESIDSDIEYVADHLRDADRLEVQAFSGQTARHALRRGLTLSDVALTGTVNGTPCCMFGFSRASLLSDVGVPWLLGTDLVRQIPRQFLVESRRIVDAVWATGTYSRLENWIAAENALSLRWIKWLGFTVFPNAPLVMRGVPFYRFEKIGDV